ncbi:MAG TPA: L-glutamate gamma-semialdehyde dehydrogenase [Polyangiaceae bacterium]|nr:L-glutamate gamma-semialdehyde dehydrogenase [Polyangiaceae bacterium]
MSDARAAVPPPSNEPTLSYAPGTPERALLKQTLGRMGAETIDIPNVIAGKEIATGALREVRSPHKHALLLARCHEGGAKEAEQAAGAALAAWPEWSRTPFTARAAIFLKAAELLATRYRPTLNAATMLGQSKTVYQAEIDSACELIDFLRFNVAFAERIHEDQPQSSAGTWNQADPRALEGFVFAATPFNFTAIAGNLPTAPALMGNTVVWKPSQNAALSAHYIMRLLIDAGLPPGVINVVYGAPQPIADALIARPELAGVHFTGSTEVFRSLWKNVGDRIASYRNFPRLVGETGGKDFVFAHPSAEVDALAVALVRGAFEYQGQKCSAASRAYLPASLYARVKERVVALMADIRMGDVADFRTFMGAVIDRRSFERIGRYIEQARADASCSIVAGGSVSGEEGFFVQPTFIETKDPKHRLMCEEIFGPVLTAWVYPDSEYERALEICDSSAPYALTGAFFARDRAAVLHASSKLRHAAGNFYINDKPTGAVVGQQPFGGARASGTNDKAGSALNLLRWTSPRIIKENFAPPVGLAYPSMGAE